LSFASADAGAFGRHRAAAGFRAPVEAVDARQRRRLETLPPAT